MNALWRGEGVGGMRKGDVRKQSILDVAERLFLEKGYIETGISDILETLHCSKGSFYHHYESKLQVLRELCARRAEAAFARYQSGTYPTLCERFNALLYAALPFGRGDTAYLSRLLPILAREEGDVIRRRLFEETRRVFLPELTRTLYEMREAKLAYFTQDDMPQMVFSMVEAFLTQSLDAVLTAPGCDRNIGARLMPALQSARFIAERLLDMRYGSVEIISLEELTRVFDTVMKDAS